MAESSKYSGLKKILSALVSTQCSVVSAQSLSFIACDTADKKKKTRVNKVQRLMHGYAWF